MRVLNGGSVKYRLSRKQLSSKIGDLFWCMSRNYFQMLLPQETVFFLKKREQMFLGSGILPPHLLDEADDDVHEHESDFNEQDIDMTTGADNRQQLNTGGSSSNRMGRRHMQFPTRIFHKKQKKMSTAEKLVKCLERMVDSIESENTSSRGAIGGMVKLYSIQECMDALDHMSGIEEGDKLWMYATRLFLKPAIRELFLTIKKDDTRLSWLQDQMERDMQRRSSSMTSVHAPRASSHHNDNASSG